MIKIETVSIRTGLSLFLLDVLTLIHRDEHYIDLKGLVGIKNTQTGKDVIASFVF